MLQIHAIWFDLALIQEDAARARVLAHWQAGARLYLVAGGYLLLLAQPRFAHCAALDGLALCRSDGILSSAPLSPAERSALPHGTCCLVRGAQAQAFVLTDADLVDPSAWIDLRAIALHEPLAFPPVPGSVQIEGPEVSRPLRDILDGTIPVPSARQQQFLRTLRGESATGDGQDRAERPTLPDRLRNLFTRAGDESQAQSGAPGTPGWRERLLEAATALAVLTNISSVIRWRQSAYLRHMLDLLANGDIAQALRHAIPLGEGSDIGRAALGVPGARDNLTISAAGGRGAGIAVAHDVQALLRKQYRDLFTRLEREGRIEEATYVLAELLNARSEAVDYLERQGRMQQAAELAELSDLPAERIVRLWFLAGEPARAMRLARLAGAFSDAVLALEVKRDPQAQVLRQVWARHLAEQGELVGAAFAIWPLEQFRHDALAWLLEAERGGHLLGVRALARKLSLMPDSLAENAAALTAILTASGEDGARLRAALAVELHGLQPYSVTATHSLMAQLLRRIIPEAQAGFNNLTKAELNDMLASASSTVFRSDLPAFSGAAQAPHRPLYSFAPPLEVTHDEHGLMPIHDARRLPDGHYLLALGEAGVLRVNAKGKQVVHFPVPAGDLVLSKSGTRALALVRRGDVLRVSRIDLVTCKIKDWLATPIAFWAPQFDGVVWNAVIDNRLVAIDCSEDRLKVLWQVADLPGKVIDFLDDGQTQTLLITGPDGLEQWRYQLPGRRLQQRESFPYIDEEKSGVIAHAGSKRPLIARLREKEAGVELSVTRPGGSVLTCQLGMLGRLPGLEVSDGWLLVHAHGADGSYRCLVADGPIDKIVAELCLPLPEHPRVRGWGGHLLMFDRRGRLLDVDCVTGAVTRLSLG